MLRVGALCAGYGGLEMALRMVEPTASVSWVAPEPTEPGPKGGRRLAATLPEWMMGLPAGYLTGEVDRLPALRGAGNGVLPAQAAMAWAILTGRVSA